MRDFTSAAADRFFLLLDGVGGVEGGKDAVGDNSTGDEAVDEGDDEAADDLEGRDFKVGTSKEYCGKDETIPSVEKLGLLLLLLLLLLLVLLVLELLAFLLSLVLVLIKLFEDGNSSSSCILLPSLMLFNQERTVCVCACALHVLSAVRKFSDRRKLSALSLSASSSSMV